MGQLVTGAGGEPYPCANQFIMDRSINPVLAAMEGSDDVHRDVLNIAWAFEIDVRGVVPELRAACCRISTLRTDGGAAQPARSNATRPCWRG